MEGQGEQIIIKKGKKCPDGHHGGAWKVAYADFVTAMMALFMVLWILSSSEEIKEEVAGYFQDPLGYTSGGGRSVIEGFATGMKNPNKKDTPNSEATSMESEKEKLDGIGKALMNQLSDSKEFQGLIDQLAIEIIDEGLRIEILDSGENAFFEIGSANVKPGLRRLLGLISAELSKINNKISIEGHTDARPFPGGNRGYTNWELSADRANATRRVLFETGINPSQILEIRGYADNRLRNKNNPFDVLNRRISIIVKYTENL